MGDGRRDEARRRRFDALFARVRHVLMRDWDPIGVRDEPKAQDEYDTYAMRLCSLFEDGAGSAAEVAAYLAYVETEWMGMAPANWAAIDRTVAALTAIARDSAAPDSP